MKQNMIKIALAASIALTGSALFAKDLPKAELAEIVKSYPNLLARDGVTVLKSQDLGNVKQLKVMIKTQRGPQEFEAFVVKGSDLIFAGTAFDKAGKKVSFPINGSVIQAGIGLKLGTGSKQLYLVTDPECPFCKKLESNLDKDKVLKEYTINVIPMPLGFHKEAKPMYRYILAAKTNAEMVKRYNETMSGGTTYKTAKLSPSEIASANKKIEAGEQAARELGARGTPSVYDNNFNKFNYGGLLKSK